MAVAHLALDLGAGHQRRHRVDDDQVERAGADQHVGDLERLLTGVGLGDQQRVGVDAERLGVVGVERVLGVDERHDAAGRLGVGHRVQRDRRLAGGLRAVDLDHAAARQAADAERHVERDRARRDHLERRPGLLAQPHDRALAELPLDVGERCVERLVAISTSHGCHPVRLSASKRSLLSSSSATTLEGPSDSLRSRRRDLGRTVPSRPRRSSRQPSPNRCSTRERHAGVSPGPARPAPDTR